MNNDNGKSYYGIGLDNSQLKSDAAEASRILQGIDEEAAKQSVSVRELLTNIPTINLEIVTNAGSTLETIDAAFAEIDRVFDMNKSAIRELEKEYTRLTREVSKAMQRNANKKTIDDLMNQATAVNDVIKARKALNKEVAATADKLAQEEQRMKADAVAIENTEKKHVSLRQRIREVKEQLIEMEIAGQRGTEAYRALQEEAGMLTDAWGDAQAQANVLAHDQRGMQGIISGLQGITGAASVAQGAIGLFGGENERLQQIMLRVQSLMAITMGLQQIQQTLNKDSAFSLVTLNSLKELWNKITGKNIIALETENAAIATNTAEQATNAVATTADTVAQTANNTSTTAGTVAQIGNATATRTATTATVAQTVATKAASLALRGLRAALISTGIGALIVLVGELVGWLMRLFETTSKADEEFKEQQEILSKGREAYAKSSIEIENYKIRLDKFKGTKEQEKQLIKELNQKYGEQIGYYKSLDEWKKALIEKGKAYCEMLQMEAEAQALSAKSAEVYIKLMEAKDKREEYKKKGFFGKLFSSDYEDEVKELEEQYEKFKKKIEEKQKKIIDHKDKNDLNFHIDPTSGKSNSGGGKTFDPQKAALEDKKAIEAYAKARQKYIKDANDEMVDMNLNNQKQGLAREINEIRRGTQRKLEAWNEQLEKLAEVRKEMAKSLYMSKKGATEVGWANSVDGKKTIQDWIEVIKSESPEVIAEFERVWNSVIADGDKAVTKVQQKYTDALIDEFGTIAQKEEKLIREWSERIALLPPEFVEHAVKQMDNELSKLNGDNFKLSINWESVFGDMSKQALPVLEFTLNKVRQYFEKNKDGMSVQEIKDYQEAIINMENEIANRNPFTAFHKSIKDIASTKKELVDAINDMKTAQEELNTAIKERNEALNEYNNILERVRNGEIESGGEEQVQAYEKLNDAKKKVADSTEKTNKAEQRAMVAQNRATSAYKTFANNLTKVGGTIKDIGGKAKDLASVFSDDVADGIGTAIEFIDNVLDATSSVINSIGDVGKSVVDGIETTVQASASGTMAAAATGATAISTIEKASVILAVISAALQVAMAIANLFNDDESKQKEIEALQGRIDQLQWELDNKEAVRLRDTYGDAVERVRDLYASTAQEILKVQSISKKSNQSISADMAYLRINAEIYKKTVEKIADAYANMSYTADKALGSKRYDEARDKLENLAKQQILIQQQINAENDKKKSDQGKIQEYEKKIEEIRAEMVSITNKILEDIIGFTAENLASELGDAFFEAAKQGEDAMEAWHKKVNDIIGDIMKRMLIQEYLEPEIGGIFNKYKDKWFDNGRFKGMDAVMDTSDQLAADLKNIGETFSQVYSGFSESLKKYTSATEEADREASQKGIATASQESVDELNGRATAIQGHTYNISEYTKQLVTTTNLILQSVLNIESETEGFGARLERMEGNLKGVKDTVEDIAMKGIKIQ